MPSNANLLVRAGQRLHHAALHDDGHGQISLLVLRFEEGNPIVLGCAGDGGIYTRKVTGDTLGPSSREFWNGAVISAIDSGGNSLTICTDQGTIVVRNLDDQLLVSTSKGMQPNTSFERTREG